MTSREREITVVFQGAIDRRPSPLHPGVGRTEYCLRRTRQAMPSAEIIVSTWEPDAAIAAIADGVVINEDPGPLVPDASPKNFLSNINRQIVSTLGGLRRASGAYVAKMRTDSFIERQDFVRFYHSERTKHPKPKFLGGKVLISALGCADPVRWPAPFHISDLFQFGRREDLRVLWDVPHCAMAAAQWHHTSDVSRWRRGGEGDRPERLAPEQYLFVAFLQKCGIAVDVDAILGGRLREFWISEVEFGDHFLVLPNVTGGVVLPERLRQYDHFRHFSFRSDLSVLNRISRSRPALAGYIAVRTPLFLASQMRWWLQYHLRPHLGSVARERYRKVLRKIMNP